MVQYQGNFLNHLEGIYRPEDRTLVVELAAALGFAAADIRFTENSRPILAVHPNSGDRDPTNNVLFLYEMPEAQRKVIDLMQRKIADDPALRAAMEEYRSAAGAMPAIMPHFGLRYGSTGELSQAVHRLESEVSPALKQRVKLFEMPSYEPVAGLPDIRQVFLRTDLLSLGTAGFEQAIELQADRANP